MNQKRTPVGQAWLRRELGLAVPQPALESYLVSGTRRTEVHGSRVVESYPRQYAPGDSVVSHLRFMLRREPFDLGVLAAALKTIDPATLEASAPDGDAPGRRGACSLRSLRPEPCHPRGRLSVHQGNAILRLLRREERDRRHPRVQQFRHATATGRVQGQLDEATDASVSVRYEDRRFHYPTDGSGNLVDENGELRGGPGPRTSGDAADRARGKPAERILP